MNLNHDISTLGGLAATFELRRRGWSKYHLGQAVAEGTIIRVRQGWYTNPEELAANIGAARVGGTVTCVSAAAQFGLWVRPASGIHVSVVPNSARLRRADDKTKRLSAYPDAASVVHWSTRHAPSSRFVASARQVVRDMAWCQSPERVVAAVDSAIRANLLSLDDWLADVASLPGRLRRLLVRVDPAAESWLESVLRFRLSMLGFSVRTQVHIAGVGRVDMILGSRLVIELDGWEFHRDRSAFEEDRRRDAQLVARGYLVLRFTFRQLTRSWPSVRDVIGSITARGWHESRELVAE